MAIAIAKDLASIDWGLTASMLSSTVMAVATLVLAGFTMVLARETRRMARAAERTEVTVTIEPNQWGLMYFDIWVTNSGNRGAYEVEVRFDPPLEGYEREGTAPPPLQRISVMRPGQALQSYLGSVEKMKEQRTTAIVTWRVGGSAGLAEEARYTIDFDYIRNASILGERNPLVQIANEVKHIRDDWKNIARGQGRLHVDTFSSADRAEQKRAREETWQKVKQKNMKQSPAPQLPPAQE